MINVLLELIQKGRIRTLNGLKGAYRNAVMKTHPDAVGSNRYLESYLSLRNQYEEAKAFLEKSRPPATSSGENENKNHRLAFFEKLHRIESLETPYAFHPEENMEELRAMKKEAMNELSHWKQELAPLYDSADKEYVRIKNEKPRGPYLMHALALNIRPLMHNLVGYHLTGRDVYAKQAKQNLSGILHRLKENNCAALRELLILLLDDMKRGPAVFD
jgi:hypothetical protein